MAHRGSEEEAGYCCYSDVPSGNSPNIQTHHLVNQLQSFESNPEIYNLTTGMEMIGFFSKTGSGGGGCGPSSSKPINESITSGHFYQHHDDHEHIITTTSSADETMMAAPPDHHSTTAAWHGHHHHHHEDQIQNRLMMQIDDSSSLRCVFPCEGNERPSQGLSLSLNSTNPSTIGLQPFELRRQDDIRFPSSSSRSDIGFFGKSMNIHQQQHLNIQDGFLGKSANLHHHGQFQIRNSKYLGPARELLNEFCNLGTKQTMDPKPKIKPHKTSHQWQQDENATTSSSKKQSLYNLELLDLQRRKAKLLSMLEEVDRRYRHYCDQMKAVVSSFEAVAGDGAASVYSALASKAMSRHFRCLRDGIVGQITATKKAMGDKDTAVAPGATRGETPRLKLLDQTLRQQRAFQQMNMMETHPWRPQRGLPERSVSVLRAWLFEHFLHPYPSDVDKHILARQTGLSRSQVSNWFINARVRLWKPMVEEMYMRETKEQDNLMITSTDDHENGRPSQIAQIRPEDQKPTQDQLVRIDSECLTSIINNPDKKEINNKHNKSPQIQQPDNLRHHHQHSFGRVAETFGAAELDFSSYNQHTGGGAGALSYDANENAHHSFGGGRGGGGGAGVSLTLGLNQHGGSGVSLAFSPTSQNSSLFYPRDQIEDCQPVQYSLLDGEGQNLPYRNLMGAQLLHDLAG